MSNYTKGARTERELLSILTQQGYSVIRSAGSGVNAISPDLVAIKKGRLISIECKAWNKSSLTLDNDQYEKLKQWESNTQFPTFVAWRMNGKGWFFVRLEEFEKSQVAYNITRSKVIKTARTLEQVLADAEAESASLQTAKL
ncbi:MAG: Holliday junction resolvase Hjc [Candidatus Micrarchaeia archaeon]